MFGGGGGNVLIPNGIHYLIRQTNGHILDDNSLLLCQPQILFNFIMTTC